MPKIPYADSPYTDFRGQILANFIEENDLVCLNTGEGTRLNNNGSLSHLDISLCNSELSSKFTWEVMSNSWGSDHYPTMTIHPKNKYANSSTSNTFKC